MEDCSRPLFSYLHELAAEQSVKKLLGDARGWLDAQTVCSAAEALGAELLRLGFGNGCLVALRADRTADTVMLLLALRAAGSVVVLTDPRHEVSEYLARCTVEIPVAAVIEPAGRSCFTLRVSGEARHMRLEDIPRFPAPLPEPDETSAAFIIFTSGSTGKSKAVVLSEYSLISNILDAEPLGDYRQDDIALGALPLDHVFGLVLLTGALVLGYSLYFPENTEIPTILRSVERERITRMNGVPSLYLAMAEQCAGYDLSSLRAGFIGGGPCTPEQFVRIEEALDMTLISAYGMSECVGITSSSYQDPRSVRANSVGRFYARNTGRILLENGAEAAPYEVGEICVDSHSRMLGYYDGDAPQPALLHTGDLGYIDKDGYVHIRGRKKDLIIRSGQNISPKRIEDALLSLPGVKAAAVVGLPDDWQGEAPYAMIVGAEDADVLSQKLQKNELPAGILAAEALPLTASGKPDKQKIREVLLAWRNG